MKTEQLVRELTPTEWKWADGVSIIAEEQPDLTAVLARRRRVEFEAKVWKANAERNREGA